MKIGRFREVERLRGEQIKSNTEKEEKFKQIKPETNITTDECKDFLKKKFQKEMFGESSIDDSKKKLKLKVYESNLSKENIYKHIQMIESSSSYDDIHNAIIDFYCESLETFILNGPTKGKTITLYHGSDRDINENIKAISVNTGTRFSKSRFSSFWTSDPQLAAIFTFQYVIRKTVHLPYCYTGDGIIYTINDADFQKHYKLGPECTVVDLLIQVLKDHPIYLYTLRDYPLDKVGRGQFDIDEYTIDEDVKPDKKEKVTFSMLAPRIKYMTYDELTAFIDKTNHLAGYKKSKSSIFEKIVYRRPEDTKDRYIKKLKSLGYKVY